MKTMMFCLAVPLLFAGSALFCKCSKASQAPEVTPSQAAYCLEYAESEYRFAVAAGSDLPDAAYEGADEECQVQWLILGAQWDDPANLDRVAELALKPMSPRVATDLADELNRYGIVRVHGGWRPTTAAEDAAADAAR